MLQLKDYQRRALDALSEYLGTTARLAGNPEPTVSRRAADVAYQDVTAKTMGRSIPYRDVGESQRLPELQGLPYVCVRIPTGGGKTVVAAQTPALAFSRLLGVERGVVLWLVPSNAILTQTLSALQNPDHPYRQALVAGVGPVEVVDVAGALQLSRTALEGQTVVIVSTIQSFRIEETESRKVYAENGSFLDAVKHLPVGAAALGLDTYEDGRPIPSLANVIRSRRPVVIVDEAHNARTDLSFETLARLAPACIIEFTATPDHEDTPSNVLFQASAAELKAEHMIKLPLALTVRPQWEAVIDDALARRSTLERLADAEQADGGRYIRPILLIQAESRSSTRKVVDSDTIRAYLKDDARVPDDWVRVAAYGEWDPDSENILDPSSDIRVIVTVQALREGWDCPFAYVLATVSNVSSSTAVEQLVGRVLRMPYVEPKKRSALNRAYVVASSPSFQATLLGLTDALVGSGFQREEAATLIQAALPEPQQLRLGGERGTPGGSLFDAVDPMESVPTVEVPLAPESVPSELPVGVSFAPERQVLRVPIGLSAEDQDDLASVLPAPATTALRAALAPHRAPSERGEKIKVPVLAVRDGDLFEPFEASHIIEAALGSWSLDDAEASLGGYTPGRERGQGAEIDVTDEGRLVSFVAQLHTQVELFTKDFGWREADLVRWLDQRLHAPDLAHAQRERYLVRLVNGLVREHGLEALIGDRARLGRAVFERINALRQASRKHAHQLYLDGEGPADLVVSPDVVFDFPANAVYSRLYGGSHHFDRHYYPEIGHLDTREEEECAVFIDRLDAVDTWVRNPVRQPKYGFWLQTSTDRFYPDFVARLKDNRILVVEYKGAHLYETPEASEKRVLGEVWANKSDGACVFTMPPPGLMEDAVLSAVKST